MSLVVKKVSYGVALRFPAFGFDFSKELTESELRQFYPELNRLESAVGDQLGTFASTISARGFRDGWQNTHGPFFSRLSLINQL